MGKTTALGVRRRPSLTCRMKSSTEFRSMPRTLIPAGARLRIAPQNCSRGELSVTKTTALDANGPTSPVFDVRLAFRIASGYLDFSAIHVGKQSSKVQ